MISGTLYAGAGYCMPFIGNGAGPYTGTGTTISEESLYLKVLCGLTLE